MDASVVEKINKYTDLVKKTMPVTKVILYGSYARGTENQWSDIDLAIITDSLQGNIIEAEYALFKLRRDIDARIEPILFNGTEDKSGFLDSILKHGMVMYSA